MSEIVEYIWCPFPKSSATPFHPAAKSSVNCNVFFIPVCADRARCECSPAGRWPALCYVWPQQCQADCSRNAELPGDRRLLNQRGNSGLSLQAYAAINPSVCCYYPQPFTCLPQVLKVAILAEKYAVDYTWYVDTILNLIRIAGDYVSEEVWYRVIQIVINRDDVQGYAAKTVFEVSLKIYMSVSATSRAVWSIFKMG